jgi:hypothetical protein
MRIAPSGVAPSPSRLFADMPPRPSAQGKTSLPACKKPWLGCPGRLRTTNEGSPTGNFCPPPLFKPFFLYDRATEQITVIVGCCVQIPHKISPVNSALSCFLIAKQRIDP